MMSWNADLSTVKTAHLVAIMLSARAIAFNTRSESGLAQCTRQVMGNEIERLIVADTV